MDNLNKEKKEELIKNLDDWFAQQEDSVKSRFDADVYRKLYKKLLTENAFIDWNSWKYIGEDVQRDFDKFPPFDTSRTDVLNRVVVVKLNGGLGTTMGCTGPKSFIEVKESLSFLDLTILQQKAFNEKYHCDIPLLLMDSFNTSEATKPRLVGKARSFEQSKCPRIYEDTLLPVEEQEERWYPPGHGNIFASLSHSGELDKLLSEGRDIMFVSNIDNTGAVIEPRIAQFFADVNAEYAMECTLKTEADVKGGTLIEIDNHIMHLEIPQVPPEHLDDFCSTKVFKIFNTNNIWVNLRAVKDRLQNIESEIIVNKKKLSNGSKVMQLETSIGGTIKAFERSYCIHVPRSRFLPVKNTNDLLTVSSDLFTLQEDYSLRLEGRTKAPLIALSPQFQKVADFHARFKQYPKMSQLNSLKVEGDVWFEEGVELKGDVVVCAQNGNKLTVPSGTVLENTSFTGL